MQKNEECVDNKFDFIIDPLFEPRINKDMAFSVLCGNPNAIHFILRTNPYKINWLKLSKNPCPEAIQLLRANPDKISWDRLSFNPCSEVIQLLRENQDKIDWFVLSWNPGIWMDTYKVAQREYFRKTITEELMSIVWHPKNIYRFEELGIEN